MLNSRNRSFSELPNLFFFFHFMASRRAFLSQFSESHCWYLKTYKALVDGRHHVFSSINDVSHRVHVFSYARQCTYTTMDRAELYTSRDKCLR